MRNTSEWLGADLRKIVKEEILVSRLFDPGPRGAWVWAELIGGGGSGGSLQNQLTYGGGAGERVVIERCFVAQPTWVEIGSGNSMNGVSGSTTFLYYRARGGHSSDGTKAGNGGGATGNIGIGADPGKGINGTAGSWVLGIGAPGGTDSAFHSAGKTNGNSGGGGGGWYGPGSDGVTGISNQEPTLPNSGAGGGIGKSGGSGRVTLLVRRL